MSDLVKCQHCTKIHDRDYECDEKNKHKISKRISRYNDERYKVYNDCYNTRQWKRVREEVLKDNNYMCEVCRELGKLNYIDIQVHHIDKVKNNKEKMYDKDNLIVVCRDHHRDIEGMNEKEIVEYVNLLKANLIKDSF
ncbi:HNH endonuclease [Paeniclostridium sordellii]|uniref:HNH endonuclease n=1 Tax=Paraclostridium sordellii TaxID=1505 RepID=UPI002149B117|nr:HNH endonuclease signature motif containing protein [Paeniclostridium sordellii]MCR1848266.1 HNH endonuclease [Paeniclostridium sordellii]